MTIDQLRSCKSSKTSTKKPHTRKSNEVDYFALVGDPCYNYNESKKQSFFQNQICSFLFIIAIPFLKKEVITET